MVVQRTGFVMTAPSPARTPTVQVVSALAPGLTARVARVKGDVRMGVPVVLTDGPDAALVVAAEGLTDDLWLALQAYGVVPEIALTRHRAQALDLQDLPVAKVVCLAAPQGCDLATLRALADPSRATPPVHGTVRAGKPLHQAAIALCKAAQLLPAALVIPVSDGAAEAQRHGLSLIDAADVLADLKTARVQRFVSQAALPMAVHMAGRVHVFRPDDGGIEHYAIEIGTPDRSHPVLVRLHSACFTGDVMGSLKCDCGPQLHAACQAMAAAGGGVLLYLNQEGRGIGMANKMRAYALQDAGHDTVEANNHLGFDDDERDFRIGSALLAQIGIASVRLLTNNPAKVRILQAHGIEVTERVALAVGKTAQNAHYLATKARKSGHLLI
jgi:GTP cyclohydrolase II